MAGRGHRQELSEPLDHPEDEGLQIFEQHDGLREQRGTDAPRRAREVQEMRFSRIINLGATGNGEHCTGCSRPTLPKGSRAT
jgi:hypothetical protein